MSQHSEKDNTSKESSGCWQGIGCLMVAIAVIAGFVLYLFSTSGPFRSVSGEGVSAAQANQRLWIRPIPESATDVWFTSSYRASNVDCKMDQDTFLKWCRESGWQAVSISEGQPRRLYSYRLGDPVLIETGFFFDAKDPKRGDVGSVGTYDFKEGRGISAVFQQIGPILRTNPDFKLPPSPCPRTLQSGSVMMRECDSAYEALCLPFPCSAWHHWLSHRSFISERPPASRGPTALASVVTAKCIGSTHSASPCWMG